LAWLSVTSFTAVSVLAGTSQTARLRLNSQYHASNSVKRLGERDGAELAGKQNITFAHISSRVADGVAGDIAEQLNRAD
jgi:hypothetical protein